MRIVLFNPFYLPIRNPRTLRIRRIIQSLKLNYSVILFCSKNSISKDQTESLVTKVGLKIFLQQNLNNSQILSRLATTLKKFIWPDSYVFHNLSIGLSYWLKYSKPLDVVITISQPFSTHLIGLLLKLKNPKICWIADIGDNYSENPTNSLYPLFKPLMKYYEKRILTKSDFIVFNSEFIKTYYLSKYLLDSNKIHIIPNGSAIDFAHFYKLHSDHLILSYIGNTYEPVRNGVRELGLLLQALSMSGMDLEKIEIWLVGKQCDALIAFVQQMKCVKIIYCDSESDLLTIYQKTNILLNFANINYPGLPSKLDEYKQSGLPIINFYFGSDDPAINYLGNEEHILNFKLENQEPSMLISFIEKYRNFHFKQVGLEDGIDTLWLELIKKTNQ